MLRRYGLPGVLAVCAYLLLGLIFPYAEDRYWQGLTFSVLAAYFIRVCDDLSDFERDRAQGKARIGKRTLILFAAGLLLGLLGLAWIAAFYWLLLFPLVVAAQFLLKEKYRDFIKLLFLPSILGVLYCFVFEQELFFLAVILAAAGIDGIIILKKRCSDDFD